MKVISGREASMFACFADLVVDPAGTLPPIATTTAVEAFDATLAASPRFNRRGLRAAVLAIELAPLALGYGKRLRRLPRPQRQAALRRLEHTPVIADVLKALRGLAHLTYYGDDTVQRLLGYDPELVLARAAQARGPRGGW